MNQTNKIIIYDGFNIFKSCKLYGAQIKHLNEILCSIRKILRLGLV